MCLGGIRMNQRNVVPSRRHHCRASLSNSQSHRGWAVLNASLSPVGAITQAHEGRVGQLWLDCRLLRSPELWWTRFWLLKKGSM